MDLNALPENASQDYEFGTSTPRRKPIPGASEAEERLLAMVTALTAELAITRERLDTVERLLEGAGVVTQTDVENFTTDEAQFSQRQGLRRRLIAKVFRPLRASTERDVDRVLREKEHGTTEDHDEPRGAVSP